MTRALGSDFISALSDTVVRPCILYEGEFESQTLRLWTGIGDLSWNDQTWYGKWLQGYDGAGETDEIKAVGVTITLAGVPQAVISLILSEAVQGKPGRLYFALLNTDNATFIGAPYLLFEGTLDVPELDDNPEGATVSISYESDLIEQEKDKEWRYTDEHQKFLHSGDRGLEFLSSLVDWSGFWGKPERKPKKRTSTEKQSRGSRARRR